ncbi:unnamed protein product [Rotaria magnacalcarata]|uniref:Eukaryotic translation initiation factor 4E binding protein 2 n=1 Tax=Rotaria magnacalcarata TaxID=392030 RepID=A0A819QDJ6_9BILA|nr:unnamed protein product [Rotaria magnacalcarata]CAF1474684.1 unnamed protein product [Rotaria magnacalcarata]CAF2051176.1 unnamed protein product [Rotaria magnacalcarata]CAF2145941.1 unnamed protein product [Rotaria magnacalcarata]CAF2166221.1 unnamed protein product [Rotaria magnacalcarata]
MSSTEGIPIRRLVVHDPKDMPLHFGETPGGSIFSTTPGGTRIYYDRAFLLSRRDSPMTRSPPHLPYIPEVTLIPEPEKSGEVVGNGVTTGKKEESESSTDKTNLSTPEQQQTTKGVKKDGDDQFSMDM